MYQVARLMLVAFVLGLFALAVLVALSLRAVALCGVFALLFMAARRRRWSLTAYGTARLATEDDLRRAGMLGESGMLLGTLCDQPKPKFPTLVKRLFTLPAKEACRGFLEPFPGHRPPLVRINPIGLVAFAPTGAGKGVSLVIPTLLHSPENTVVLDIKGDLYKETAHIRRMKFGHKIVALDPFKRVTDTPDTLNMLDWINKDDPLSIDDIRDIAEALVVRKAEEKEAHWNDSAEMVIGAVATAVVNFGKAASLQEVKAAISDPTELQAAISEMQRCDKWGGILRRMGSQLLFFEGKEKASVVTTCMRHLRFLDSPAVYESTIKSTFDPGELKTGRITIYLVIPPERLRSLSGLLRLWITSLLRACVR